MRNDAPAISVEQYMQARKAALRRVGYTVRPPMSKPYIEVVLPGRTEPFVGWKAVADYATRLTGRRWTQSRVCKLVRWGMPVGGLHFRLSRKEEAS